MNLYDFVGWLVGGGIVLAIAVAAIIIFASNRKAKHQAAELSETGVEASSDRSELDRPEAPVSRLTRLRRLLAGKDNLLARGLLQLLKADRISDDTWDELEAAL
ncbi:MAG: signal recognition particle-docking protein FtsY, partial [Propionibacteriaceae bacterium]|nr:signal recognition particle-docking protein FtsY [Propionibacteriaceae bacterium]